MVIPTLKTYYFEASEDIEKLVGVVSLPLSFLPWESCHLCTNEILCTFLTRLIYLEPKAGIS